MFNVVPDLSTPKFQTMLKINNSQTLLSIKNGNVNQMHIVKNHKMNRQLQLIYHLKSIILVVN